MPEMLLPTLPLRVRKNRVPAPPRLKTRAGRGDLKLFNTAFANVKIKIFTFADRKPIRKKI